MTRPAMPRIPLPLPLLALMASAAGCGGADEPVQTSRPEGLLPDEALARGVDHRNRSGGPGKATILEANGAGVALLDLGNDGDLDLIFAQGLGSLEALRAGPGADLEVFENLGQGRFERATGPGLSGWWTGLGVGDVNNDGRDDLVAGGFGDLVLLLQDEEGQLVPTETSGLAPEGDARLVPGESSRTAGAIPSWATSLALLDIDRDGALDLYVGRYLELDPFDPPLGALGEGDLALPCRFKGYPVFCGPRGLEPQADLLYLGDGSGGFTNVTETHLAGIAKGFTLGVAAFDAEGDGDSDLFIATDSAPNQLLINHDGERLLDRAQHAGVALSQDGRPEAGMGVAFADVNRDGVHDFVVTNFSSEPTELYFGNGSGYALQTYRLGLSSATRRLLSWGVHLVDLDGDGWLELFTANGHVYPQADEPYTGTSYGQPDSLWSLKRTGDAMQLESWEERVTSVSVLAPALGSRGSAIGDLDGNGTPDLVISRIDEQAGLGMNYEGAENYRLWIRLIGDPESEGKDGKRTPRDAHGARVAVVLTGDSEALLGEVQSSSGYQSASSAPLHFGLGKAERYHGLKVFWPSGLMQEFPGGPADRMLVLTEGETQVVTREFQ